MAIFRKMNLETSKFNGERGEGGTSKCANNNNNAKH